MPILWGFFHRCGGGMITCPGHKVIFRGLAPAILFAIMYQSWWMLLTAPGFWLGNAITGYSKHWYVENWKDFWFMTWRGFLFTVFPALIMAFINWQVALALSLSGLIMGVAYYTGKKWPNEGAGMVQGPECSEFVFGLFMDILNYAFYLTNSL